MNALLPLLHRTGRDRLSPAARRGAFVVVLAAICFATGLGAVHAQEAAGPAKRLKVVVKPVKPFAFEEGGQMQGYSVDLWKRVALEAGIPFEFETVKTMPDLVSRLKAHTADVGIGALSVTAEREVVIDFSQSIYDESGLQILARTQNRTTLGSAFREFLSFEVLKVVVILFLALFGFGHILWAVERRKNPDCFPAAYPAGVIEATWWSVSTLITSGCENISPGSVFGRLLAVSWMLISVALVSLVTATLSAKLTVDKLTTEIRGLGDLQGAVAGTVTGSPAADFLEKRNLNFKGYDTVEDACAGLLKGETKAVLYDAPILRYYLSTNPGGNLKLVGERFDRHNYAFGLQAASPLRKQINQTLLTLRETGFIDELQNKWFAVKDE